MRTAPVVGTSLLLLAGYLAFKWGLAGSVNEERLVALGGMYHWSALTALVAGWSMWLVRTKGSTMSFWGDFKLLAKPVFLYALLAAGSVYVWNHVIANESTELRKALRVAQIEEHTATEAAYAEFVNQQAAEQQPNLPSREEYRSQALAQVNWMLSGGVTLVLSLLTYLFASLVLVVCATILLHQIWGVATLG
jgi:hypothetical protein